MPESITNNCNLCGKKVWKLQNYLKKDDGTIYHKKCILDHIVLVYLAEHKISWEVSK